MPFLPAGPPAGSPPDLTPIELLLQRELHFFPFYQGDVTQQYITTCIQAPFVPEDHAFFIERLDDVGRTFPA